ncbi:hypothetical protein N7462_003100 [Penicillium macrosclerotiorum]|uniref:uncharacterized protein n=1 Tax=Penicillium macrosclerotiorum TaxID=303699 RepID=UPI002547CE7B|nr:uncharacterized protein N7462_003100 [Penicillium macrosclerotiorum]KAJ5688708.1 hypothetical protein N7462_003100 [Penicillium macrosclerotiorum]
MSYHPDGRTSPISQETEPSGQNRVSHKCSSSQLSSPTPRDPRLSGLSRAVQNLLNTPQSARRSGTGAGGAARLSRRGSRSPVEPFKSSPLRISSSAMASAPSSPERHKDETGDVARRSSDQFSREGDRPAPTSRSLGLDEDARSDISTVSLDQIGLKKKSHGRKSVAAMMSGLESRLFPKSFTRGRDVSRGSSRRGSSLDSRSPSSTSRLSRSVSPATRHSQSGSSTTEATSERGKAIKIDDAHNKSDEALAKLRGRLPDYVKPADQEESGERLAKDVFDRDKNIIESSDDDGDDDSSEDEQISGIQVVQTRGRQEKSSDISSITSSDFNKPKTPKFHIAEEQQTANKSSIPNLEKKPKKSALKTVIHPRTSFDIPTPYAQSAAGTPYGSEDEAEKADVHRAQQLSISMSTIDNRVPNRSIRTIIRGDFAGLQEEADGGRRRQRKYLVATDLSEESVYALEWTIGAVLREGDTMYAIYAMHEDLNTSVQVGEGAKAMQDAAAVVGSQTKEATQGYGTGPRNILGLLGPLGPGTVSKSSSVDSRASPMAEAERVRAVETVSNTCVQLLRKTLLQVRIAVEVIHCKSPKLMITEAIDELEPTLVIVGARGQSALKGVLLGSFSNYLLSNSSVPVMVARRKLKRHPSKGKIDSSNVRLSNNLRTPKSLTQAKID